MLSVALSISLAIVGVQGEAKTVLPSPGDLKIVSAIFGAKEGSIDVTSIVEGMVRPGMNEFYAAPKWLGFDPARTVNKDLVIAYDYRSERRYFTVPEEGAVSYDILTDQAQPATEPNSPDVRKDGGLKIVAAFFGNGGTFVEVTNTVAQLIYSGERTFVANESSMRVNPLPNWTKDLIVTYEFEGKRRNFFTPNSSNHMVSYDILVENARANGMATTHTNAAPVWLETAHPMSIAEADAFAVALAPLTATERLARENATNPNPRAPSRALRIEAAITALLSAQQALRDDSFREAKADIEKALHDARATIAYVYPPPEQEKQPIANTAADPDNPRHFERILASLNTALNELKQATPGGKGQFLPDAIAETQLAIADVMARH